MKIKINNTDYLVYQTSISSDRVQASIIDVTDVDDLLSDAKTTTEVVLYDDEDNMTDTFAGVSFLALIIMYDEDSISVEFERSKELKDLQEQIFTTDNKVNAQGETLNNLSEQVSEITPYTDTKTAYIDDTEVVFNGVPDGALLVSFSNGNTSYSISREDGVLTVGFAPFDEVVEVTITVQ